MSFFDFSILMSFYDKATVIGEGLSVIKFFIDPLEKLAPANEKTVSESPFLA
jgi:hypothetical protein